MRQRSMFTRIALTAAGTAALLSSGGGASATSATSGTAVTSGAAATSATAVTNGTAVTAATGAASPAAAGVSSRQAAEIARRKVPGARVTRVRHVWDQGIWNWRVELVKAPWRYDLFVSVRSGRVVRLKIDYGR
ncbi:PepSY domain-containing protein [Planomonospora sp. ID82291]|uniref:PepSY domain-containing protein n=1 Tax=Planomonospora sp. ID82291 TaxID=2738136 RepID=UPI0018C3D7D6|nr:peptidase [Planomonospora sp. ID82291]MBG0815964.1 peptidase [Planomonospora sp. ID82291]